MEKMEELKGLVLELSEKSVKKAMDEQKAKDEAWQKAFSEKSVAEQNDIKSRLEAIEKLPLKKTTIGIPGTDKSTDIIYGFKAGRQFADIFNGQRLAHAKDLIVRPEIFPIIADAEKRGEYAKHLLMVIKAAMGDFKAKQDYDSWHAKATLQEGSATVGGYLVPDEFANEILAFARLNSFALNDCRIWPMASDTLLVPREDSKVAVSWKAESVAAAQSNPTFGQVQLIAKKLTAYATATNELLQDGHLYKFPDSKLPLLSFDMVS